MQSNNNTYIPITYDNSSTYNNAASVGCDSDYLISTGIAPGTLVISSSGCISWVKQHAMLEPTDMNEELCD